jgi:hypothetical protein
VNQETPGQPDPPRDPVPPPPFADPLAAAPSAPLDHHPAPPAYPHPAYQPPGYPAYQMPGARTPEYNGAAIASLIFGILGGILFSVVFGLIALRQIVRRGGRGRGMAIAGLSLSAVWAVLFVAVGTSIVLTLDGTTPLPRPTAAATARTDSTAEGRHQPAESLKVGDCLGYLDENSTPEDFTFRLCSDRHGGEVFDVWSLAPGAYPGDTEVEKQVTDRCYKTLARYAVGTFADARLYYVYPTRDSWSYDRGAVCIAVPSSDQWTGSMVNP